MHPLHFSYLQSNLSEIYRALHAKSEVDDELPLYLTSSSFVYFQGSWTGKLIRLLDRIWRWIHPSSYTVFMETILKLLLTTLFDHAVHSAYDARQRRIWSHMREIDKVWKDTLQPQDFVEQRERYAHFLSKELKGSIETESPIYLADFDERAVQPWNEQELKIHRHTIVNFHQATYLFWSLFIKNEEENREIRQPIMQGIPPQSTLLDRPLYEALEKEGRWIQMEGVMQQSIPVTLFAKLYDPDSLTVNENKCLKQWVEKVNECGASISPKLFSCVLNEIIHIIHLQGSSPLTLPDLLVWLDEQGCEIIHRKDPAHLDWRERLRPGDTIECNGKALILGKQLGADKLVKDTFKVFELENYPDYVVKIADSCSRLLREARQVKDEQGHWGVRLVKTIPNIEEEGETIISGLDLEGRCVVLEKLTSSFDSQNWTSRKLELTQEDEKKALVFANHIFCMSQWKATAQNLSLTHLMWDQKGVLKSTHPLKKGEPNYNDWEAYCEKAANGNLYVLNFLMNISKLHEHPIGLYYRNAVEQTLKTGKTDLIGRPLPLGYRQEIYNQHIRELCAQAQEIRENCFEVISAHLRRKGLYSYQQEGKLQQVIDDKLVEFYRASPTPGRCLADLEQRVIASLTESTSLASLPDPKDVKDYYQEKHQLMMDYNQALVGIDPNAE